MFQISPTPLYFTKIPPPRFARHLPLRKGGKGKESPFCKGGKFCGAKLGGF
jgi:hypothetical protein